MKSFLGLIVLLFSFQASAYSLLIYGQGTRLQDAKPFHILLAGEPHELGNLFVQSAAAKAARLQTLYPDRTIVLYMGNVDWQRVQKAISLGFNIQENNGAGLSGEVFTREMLRFPRIASIDIFVHSSAGYGSLLEDNEERFDLRTPRLADLRSRFIEGAYAELHGCNTGFDHAQGLAKLWNIPVFGSLSSMNFQHPWSDGTWYFNDSGLQPTTGKWASGRTRMAVDNHPYTGMRGSFPVGLGISKAYCAQGETTRCLRGIANRVLAAISVKNLSRSSTKEDYFQVVADLMCPVSSKRNLKQDCISKLRSDMASPIDRTTTFFSGQSLQCDLKGCQVRVQCGEGTCSMSGYRSGATTTFVDEFRLLMKAYTHK